MSIFTIYLNSIAFILYFNKKNEEEEVFVKNESNNAVLYSRVECIS